MVMQVALGTWQSTPSHGFWADQDTAVSEKTILRALELGITCFDCAQGYGNGRAEQLLGKILGRTGAARDVLVDTKIMPTTGSVRNAVLTSLARLKVNRINRLYLHWPSSRIDWKQNLRQMSVLKEEGLVRKIGVCNLSPGQLEEVTHNLCIDSFQRPLSLIWSREYEQTKAFCSEKGIELVVCSPLGMGILNSRYRSPADFPASDPRCNLFCFAPSCKESLGAILSACTMEDALLWVKTKEPDVLLLGARNPLQLEQDLSFLGKAQDAEKTRALDILAENLSNASLPVCDNMFSYRW